MSTVLVVDDTADIRRLASISLKNAGFTIMEAASGPEALEIISATPPDLVVLDVMMPGMTGFEVLQEVRSRMQHLDLPIIFLTAKSDLSDKEKGFELGAEDYITKPFVPKELVLRVTAHLRLKVEGDKLRHDAQVHEQLSATDELTQTYNRRHLLQRMKEEISEAVRYGRPVSFIMFDIDHFKQINDTRGHLAGDDVLRQLSALTRSNIRQEDILARYGGEEFGILLPTTPAETAAHTAERLRQMVEANVFTSGEAAFHVTISIGVAGFPADPIESNEELIEVADKRLYAAKFTGRNKVVGPENWEAAA